MWRQAKVGDGGLSVCLIFTWPRMREVICLPLSCSPLGTPAMGLRDIWRNGGGRGGGRAVGDAQRQPPVNGGWGMEGCIDNGRRCLQALPGAPVRKRRHAPSARPKKEKNMEAQRLFRA